jgi:hypothetical protein
MGVSACMGKNALTQVISENGHCWKCNYDLRGINSRRCPKCGWPFSFQELLNSPLGVELMKPTQWIGWSALPIASIALVLDWLLLFTPYTLLVLTGLWFLVAQPYTRASSRRNRLIFEQYPRSGLRDPDLRIRRKIGIIFLLIGLIVFSGFLQAAVIAVSLPWLTPYAKYLNEERPLMQESSPEGWTWKGVLPVRGQPQIWGADLHVGFASLRFRNDMCIQLGHDWDPIPPDDNSIRTSINDHWEIRRPEWRLSLDNFWPSLY